jgi:hypothetical protein
MREKLTGRSMFMYFEASLDFVPSFPDTRGLEHATEQRRLTTVFFSRESCRELPIDISTATSVGNDFLLPEPRDLPIWRGLVVSSISE